MLPLSSHVNTTQSKHKVGGQLSDSDFITDYMLYMDDLNSPRLFKLWSGISIVASSLERRVIAKTGSGGIYPNLFIMLVATPGIGKYVIEHARRFLMSAKEPGAKVSAFHIAPNSMTTASLVDEVKKAQSTRILPEGAPFLYHSLAIFQEEFQVLLPGYDVAVISKLNSLYNNLPDYSETRRTGSVKELLITNPQINILAGAQPAYFAATFPEEAWNTGFVRRILMVYSNERVKRSLWYTSEKPEGLKESLLLRLGKYSQMHGTMKWAKEAADFLDSWYQKDCLPAPEHSKLEHYSKPGNRVVLTIKLAIISAVSRTGGMLIEEFDVRRAKEWLLEIETRMPDIFREMIGKSDSAVIEETHLFVTRLYTMKKRSPVNGESIMRFLLARVPSEKAKGLLESMVAANILARAPGVQDAYIPKPKNSGQGEE